MALANEALNLWLEDSYGDIGVRLRLRECLFSSTSPFQRIAVYDSHSVGRVLTLGGSTAITDFDEAFYSEGIVHPALSVATNAKRVLILGGGDGGVAREAARYAQIEQITVVELDQQVVDVCKRFFPAAAAGLADKRVELVIDDAHRFLRDTKTVYDVIIVDACELENPASDAFHSVTFAQSVFRCLAPDGVLVAPLGSPSFTPDACRTTLRRLSERFPQPRVYRLDLPTIPGGQLAVAWCAAKLRPDAAVTAQPWHKDLRWWEATLQPALFAAPRHVRQQLGLG